MDSSDPHKPNNNLVTRDPADIFKEIEDVSRRINESVFTLRQKHDGYYSLANEIGWHVRGLTYHYRNLLDKYQIVCAQIAERAITSARPGVLIFHSPEMQALLFEFYSIVTLSRIALDHLVQHTMLPLFSSNLPGSMNTFLKGESDYNLHKTMNEEPEIRYLIDIRDCMVHYRTFAVADNTVALSDSIDESGLPDINGYLKYPITRTYFRITSDNKLSVNILLPDEIYRYTSEGNRNGLVKDFQYTERNNILRKSMDFIMVCGAATIHTLDLISNDERNKYKWKKANSGAS